MKYIDKYNKILESYYNENFLYYDKKMLKDDITSYIYQKMSNNNEFNYELYKILMNRYFLYKELIIKGGNMLNILNNTSLENDLDLELFVSHYNFNQLYQINYKNKKITNNDIKNILNIDILDMCEFLEYSFLPKYNKELESIIKNLNLTTILPQDIKDLKETYIFETYNTSVMILKNVYGQSLRNIVKYSITLIEDFILIRLYLPIKIFGEFTRVSYNYTFNQSQILTQFCFLDITIKKKHYKYEFYDFNHTKNNQIDRVLNIKKIDIINEVYKTLFGSIIIFDKKLFKRIIRMKNIYKKYKILIENNIKDIYEDHELLKEFKDNILFDNLKFLIFENFDFPNNYYILKYICTRPDQFNIIYLLKNYGLKNIKDFNLLNNNPKTILNNQIMELIKIMDKIISESREIAGNENELINVNITIEELIKYLKDKNYSDIDISEILGNQEYIEYFKNEIISLNKGKKEEC